MSSVCRLIVATGIMVGCTVAGAAQAPAAKTPSSTAKPKSTTTAKTRSPLMRDPFTIRLKLDKEHYDEFHFGKQPYVSENEVYLFSGDKFGVNLTVKEDRVVAVSYQPNVAKADLVFGFEQPKELQDGLAMALTIDNK